LSLGDEYRPLLSRIELRFLSVTGLAILVEHFFFPPECVCYGILDRLLRWNSAIVPDFPKLFTISRKKDLLFCGAGSLMVSVIGTFTATATGM
jgi:hypothetical protein